MSLFYKTKINKCSQEVRQKERIKLQKVKLQNSIVAEKILNGIKVFHEFLPPLNSINHCNIANKTEKMNVY